MLQTTLTPHDKGMIYVSVFSFFDMLMCAGVTDGCGTMMNDFLYFASRVVRLVM